MSQDLNCSEEGLFQCALGGEEGTQHIPLHRMLKVYLNNSL